MEVNATQETAKVPVTVFQLSGNLTEEEPLLSSVKSQYDSGMRYAMLDLSKVKYISSGGLRALHAVFTLLRGDGPEESDAAIARGLADGSYTSRHLKLYKPSKEAKKVLQISGYDMFLEVHTKYKDALNSFG